MNFALMKEGSGDKGAGVMGRIFYLMGKSATGKDTVYKELRKQFPNLKTVVPYTTRPIREGEKNGVEYFFRTIPELEELKKSGKVIELRVYQTVVGPWYYFTMDDGQFDLSGKCEYLMIGTLESYEKMYQYFGKEYLIPIYIEIPDEVRLKRAVDREAAQQKPNFKEVCRRYLADEEDFSEDHLNRLGIEKRYVNLELECCLKDISDTIQSTYKQR